MSAARRLVAEAMRAGVVFKMNGLRLRMVPRPGEAVPQELVARAKAIRADLVSYLTAAPAVAAPAIAEPSFTGWDEADWTYAIEERAGILEFDSGYDRADAERIAASEIAIMRRGTIH